ncbi:hypothetical protein BJV74DRAFT_859937 [Russula compacta]|nr:hypothetical protein BJV74DRAFT_859937 [Russula compacta]
MSRSPPALIYLAIYNPTLKPSSPVADDDDEDAEEQAHILFYTSRERAVSRDRMLRQVGLAKALVNFSEMFVSGDACDNVHSQSRRMIMVSPEPGFWIHACIELAKTPRTPAASKGKAKAKAADKGKNGEGNNVVYDYNEGSVHDLALRAQVLRGYEEFKLTHGSFTSILGTLGQQALELQLERFFTVWAWKWDIQEDSELGNCLGTYTITPFVQVHRPTPGGIHSGPPLLEELCAFCPRTSTFNSLRRLLEAPSSSCPTPLRPLPLASHPDPLLLMTPSEPSPVNAYKPGTDIFASSMNATREAMEATGHAFVAIGASMDVRKWSWPGYLTFNKGIPSRTTPEDRHQPQAAAGAENSSEEKPVEEAVADSVAGEPAPPSSEAGLQGEVDRESLHEAMSSDGRESHHEEGPSAAGEENASAVDSTAQTGETAAAVADDALETASDSLRDEQELSPPTSPSTPIIRPLPSSLTSPPSLSSSQSTIPVPVPAPSFRSFSLHFSPQDDPLTTAQRRVLYITKEQLTLAFLEPTPTVSEDDKATLYQNSSALLANIQGLIDHDEASNTETPVTAAKILQPKDKHLIVTGNDTMVTSAEFTSHSEHLFSGSQMIANGDATEVFSRTQGPQHWHIARREPEGTVYLEVLRKEASLADVENELVGIVRRFRESR